MSRLRAVRNAGLATALSLELALAALLVAPGGPARAQGAEAADAADTVRVAPPAGETEIDRSSILAALDAVEPGGAILFAPGTYLVGEMIRVSAPGITLLGHPEGTTLRGCEPATFDDIEVAMAACGGLQLIGQRQTVRGLTFEHAWEAVRVGWLRSPAGADEASGPTHVGGHLIEDNTFRAIVNGFRVIGDSPEPVVVRDNDFVNVWHAGGVNGRTAHVLDNRISVPDPGAVPPNGFPGLALFIIASDTRAERIFTCAGNVIAGNEIDGHPEAVAILAIRAGASCRDNVIRDNAIRVARVRFTGTPWGVIGIRHEADSTLAGVPVALAELAVEMADRFGLPAPSGDEALIRDNLVEGNRIVGAEGVGIEIMRASGNRIVDNTVTDVTERDPFPGNTMSIPPPWRAANGSGIWLSPDSDGNEIVGNTFEDVEDAAVVLEGDSNRVEVASPDDEVRDLGTGNRIEGPSVYDSDALPNAPPALDDGWEVAAPAEVGLDPERLAELTDSLRTGAWGNVHALLIEKDGKLVYEEYFTGRDESLNEDLGRVRFGRTSLHDLRSVGKSLAATLLGIAIGEGADLSVDEPLRELLPDYAHLLEGEKRGLRLRHALTMRAGLRYDEWSLPYGDSANDWNRLKQSSDPTAFLLGLELAHEPGTTFTYNTGLTQLLATVLERATGEEIERYADRVLFEPLGIYDVVWRGDIGGIPSVGAGMRMRARDLAKVGSIHLNEGRWNGRQIISPAWIQESTGPHWTTEISESFPRFVRGAGYGYQWWWARYATSQGTVEVASMLGNGLQRVMVVPELGLAMTMFAGHYDDPDPDVGWIPARILVKHVIEAMSERAESGAGGG